MRIDYGSAEARIDGWIPVEAVIELHVDAAGESAVRALVSRPGLPGRRTDGRPAGWDAQVRVSRGARGTSGERAEA